MKKDLKRILILILILLLLIPVLFGLGVLYYRVVKRVYVYSHADIYVDGKIDDFILGSAFEWNGKRYFCVSDACAGYESLTVKIDGKQKTYLKDHKQKHYVIHRNITLREFIKSQDDYMILYGAEDDPEAEMFFVIADSVFDVYFAEDIIDRVEL